MLMHWHVGRLRHEEYVTASVEFPRDDPPRRLIADGRVWVLADDERPKRGPRLGEREMVGGRLVKVLSKKYDHRGRLLVLDEDTGHWLVWPTEND